MALVIVGNRKSGRDGRPIVPFIPSFVKIGHLVEESHSLTYDRHIRADDVVFLQVCVFPSWDESRLSSLGAQKTSLKLEYSTVCDVAGKKFTPLFYSTCSFQRMLKTNRDCPSFRTYSSSKYLGDFDEIWYLGVVLP